MRRIVDGLFPTHELRENLNGEESVTVIPEFTEAELMRAVSSPKPGKAPGPDGIPGEIIRLAACKRPRIFLDLYKVCLRCGAFCDRWKTARLVLIPKDKGEDLDSPSSYRPLSLLDTPGKVYELLLKPRLAESITAADDLPAMQKGFRTGFSTIGAIREVVEAFKRAQRPRHAIRPVVVLVTLDVKNAFNSARWEDILEALRSEFKVPSYIMRVLEDYFSNRTLIYKTKNEKVTRKLTAGVARARSWAQLYGM